MNIFVNLFYLISSKIHCNDVFHFFVWPRLSSYIINKSRETSRIFAWLRKENRVNKNF